jgi:hypothetical protein
VSDFAAELIQAAFMIALGLYFGVVSPQAGMEIHKNSNTGSPEAYAIVFRFTGYALAAAGIIHVIIILVRGG